MVARGVNAIITSALDPSGSVGAIARASKAKIPVICYNTCLNEADKKKYVKGFIYADQAGLGKMTGEYAAKYIKEKLGGKANIALVTCDSFPICRERKKAFLAALDKDGIQYKIVADQEAYLVDKSVPAAENMLTANPDVQVLWGRKRRSDHRIGQGRLQQRQGRKVVVFGTDMTPEIGNFLVTPDPILHGDLCPGRLRDWTKGGGACAQSRGRPADRRTRDRHAGPLLLPRRSGSSKGLSQVAGLITVRRRGPPRPPPLRPPRERTSALFSEARRRTSSCRL